MRGPRRQPGSAAAAHRDQAGGIAGDAGSQRRAAGGQRAGVQAHGDAIVLDLPVPRVEREAPSAAGRGAEQRHHGHVGGVGRQALVELLAHARREHHFARLHQLVAQRRLLARFVHEGVERGLCEALDAAQVIDPDDRGQRAIAVAGVEVVAGIQAQRHGADAGALVVVDVAQAHRLHRAVEGLAHAAAAGAAGKRQCHKGQHREPEKVGGTARR